MCDYSLMNIPNRLANEGETLVTYKFVTGSIGFASLSDLVADCEAVPCESNQLWRRVCAWFTPPAAPKIPAVCIPPGARLRIIVVPDCTHFSVPGAEVDDEIQFTQTTAAWNQYRDALRSSSGDEILLQSIGQGLQVQVVDLSLGRERLPAQEEQGYTLVRRR